MPVRVLVLDRFVEMLVLVPLGQVEPHADGDSYVAPSKPLANREYSTGTTSMLRDRAGDDAAEDHHGHGLLDLLPGLSRAERKSDQADATRSSGW